MCEKCQPERTGKRGWALAVLTVAILVVLAFWATTPGVAGP